MSILDNDSSNISQAKLVADRLKKMTKTTYAQMAHAFNEGSQIFWQNASATPLEIASELGEDAKEIFELHYKLGQLISTIKPESISQGLSVIGNFTINDDGTVTINEE